MLTKRITYFWLALFMAGPVSAKAADGWVGSGKKRVVGQPSTPSPGATYTTIGAAVTDANPGDEIDICPALYTEQLIITKPLKLLGVEANGVNRALLQPSLTDLMGLATEAVITVMNTQDVVIQNLAIDASQNTVASCSPSVAGVHFFNASGKVQDSAIFGAKLADPTNCPTLRYGNGYGVLIDSSQPGPFTIAVEHNSIHDYGTDGVLVKGQGGTPMTAEIRRNTISGPGPALGAFQFGIYIAYGPVAHIKDNFITEGLCGSLTLPECIAIRSEGVVLRVPGDGTVVEGNIISDAQSGIFINGANDLKVTNNQISNIYGQDGIDIQGTAAGYFTNSTVKGNRILNIAVSPEGCGIYEASGSGTFSGNEISDNVVNDAYCGVTYNPPDTVSSGIYFNVLYTLLNSATLPYPPGRRALTGDESPLC